MFWSIEEDRVTILTWIVTPHCFGKILLLVLIDSFCDRACVNGGVVRGCVVLSGHRFKVSSKLLEKARIDSNSKSEEMFVCLFN